MAAVVQPQDSTYRSRFLWLDRERGRFLVHRSAYSSPEIFEEEKRRILRKSWIVLGHDCEVPKKGDFIVIPAGIPHWFKEVPQSVNYYFVKVVKP